MPTYDYFCTNCGFEKEYFHGMLEEPEIICDKCKEIMKKKVSGGVATIFRGQGWASKGTATASSPRHFKEIGIGVPEVMKDVVSEDVKKSAVKIQRGK